MFERFCALLLRLYPPEFRRAYGDDAAQLIRDRASDERGVLKRTRLLMDLTADLFAISLRGWHGARPLVANSGQRDGTPRFDVIEVSGPRPEALAVGLLTSALMFASFTLLFQPRAFPPAPAQVGDASRSPEAAIQSSDSAQQTVATDRDARDLLIATIAANLKQRYFDRATGQQLAEALLAHDKEGAYKALTGTEVANRINTHIRETGRALEVPAGTFVAEVVYSEQRFPDGPPHPQTTEMRARYRERMLHQNCLFEAIEMLPLDIGYLKLNGFPDATGCRDTTERAMRSVNGADALIVDLRDNVGGFGDMALQIAAYFFDRPPFLYDPRPNSRVAFETWSSIPGNKLVDKPVYILTSSRTQSAAEYFVYNLKMLKRATVVGETTAGRQHSGAFHRINDHFGMGIQDTTPPDNPFPVKGWEVIGVEPDLKVSSTEAFDAARRLAESRRR
jgi:Peptidase family S41